MKSRTSRLVDLRQGLDYQFEAGVSSASDEPLGIVASNCSFSAAAAEMEFRAVRALRPDVRRPYLHISLSCPPGERLPRRTWARVIRFVLDDVGLDTRRHQYIARRHARNRLDHCHILVNRVALDALIWAGEFEAWRFIKACQRAERELGLGRTVGLHDMSSNVPHEHRPRTGNSDSVVRSNRQSQRKLGRVQDARAMSEKLQDCAARALSFRHFQELALRRELEVVEVVDDAWRFSGVVVRETWAQHSFKLSSITSGRWNFQKLQSQFERNRDELENARRNETVEFDVIVDQGDGESSAQTTKPLRHQKGRAGRPIRSSEPKQDRRWMEAMMAECAERACDFGEFQALALRRKIVVIEIAIKGKPNRILIRQTGTRKFHTLSSITRGRLDARRLALQLEVNERWRESAERPQEEDDGVDAAGEEGMFELEDYGDSDTDWDRPGERLQEEDDGVDDPGDEGNFDLEDHADSDTDWDQPGDA